MSNPLFASTYVFRDEQAHELHDICIGIANNIADDYPELAAPVIAALYQARMQLRLKDAGDLPLNPKD